MYYTWEYSEFFDLERGNAQGDTTSPFIFNLGFQVLLLKLSFDLHIECLIDFPLVLDTAPSPPVTVSTYTRKIYAYADDANLIVKMNYENLTRIKTILEDFGSMSGLVCNVEKTSILPIGGQFQIDNRIRDLGFTIVDRLTVLGLEIDREGYTQTNFTNIRKKICSHISSWRPFNLSLPGRINIAKSLLYSQINYLGCFLPVPEATMSDWDKLITDFVKGKLNIAKKCLYLTPSEGGLGLFNISDFLDAQRCTWIRRSTDLSEPWKAQIYIRNHCCLYNCKSKNIDKLSFQSVITLLEVLSNFPMLLL